MLRPPPPTQLPMYPITGGVCLLAAGVTLAWDLGYSIAPLTMSGIHFVDQPWRLFTSTLPHVNLLHLAFNAYWTWTFGTFLERQFGHWRMALLVLLLAASSGAAELAILDGGVGLSGVGYGLFGLLWVLSYRDPRFLGTIDGRTVQTFVLWFFLCVALTYMHLLPVANVAHGVGALLGAAVGWAIALRGTRRLGASGLAAALVVASFLGATVFRPWVNFSSHATGEYVDAACDKLSANKPKEALPLLEKATEFRYEDGYGWYNMGVAYEQLGQIAKANACFRKAIALAPNNPDFAGVRHRALAVPSGAAPAATTSQP